MKKPAKKDRLHLKTLTEREAEQVRGGGIGTTPSIVSARTQIDWSGPG